MLVFFFQKKIVLKHRQNTNQKQRIVAFLASPLPTGSTKESMNDLGMKLKKNGVAIDIIDFGTENRANAEILKELIESVNSEAHPSILVSVESGSDFGSVHLLDSLKSSTPELFNLSSASGGAGGADGFDFDPELDPELAMALKLSMEEEVNRQKKAAAANSESAESADQKGNGNTNNTVADDVEEDDEEMMLARAIALSMEQEGKK